MSNLEKILEGIQTNVAGLMEARRILELKIASLLRMHLAATLAFTGILATEKATSLGIDKFVFFSLLFGALVGTAYLLWHTRAISQPVPGVTWENFLDCEKRYTADEDGTLKYLIDAFEDGRIEFDKINRKKAAVLNRSLIPITLAIGISVAYLIIPLPCNGH